MELSGGSIAWRAVVVGGLGARVGRGLRGRHEGTLRLRRRGQRHHEAESERRPSEAAHVEATAVEPRDAASEPARAGAPGAAWPSRLRRVEEAVTLRVREARRPGSRRPRSPQRRLLSLVTCTVTTPRRTARPSDHRDERLPRSGPTSRSSAPRGRSWRALPSSPPRAPRAPRRRRGRRRRRGTGGPEASSPACAPRGEDGVDEVESSARAGR